MLVTKSYHTMGEVTCALPHSCEPLFFVPQTPSGQCDLDADGDDAGKRLRKQNNLKRRKMLHCRKAIN